LNPDSGVRGRCAGTWTLFPSSHANPSLLRNCGNAQDGELSWFGVFSFTTEWIQSGHQSIRQFTGHSAPLGAREVAAACFSTLVTSRFGKRSIFPERLSLIHKISNCQAESDCVVQAWQWSGRGRAKKSIERAGRKRIPFMVGFSLQPALLVAGLTNELSETGGGRQRKAGTTCREVRSRAASCQSSEERPERQRERLRELGPGPSLRQEWADPAAEEEEQEVHCR
jgi:hypothetical protein